MKIFLIYLTLAILPLLSANCEFLSDRMTRLAGDPTGTDISGTGNNNDNSDKDSDGNITVPANLYVHHIKGLPDNPGTMAEPLSRIQDAVNLARNNEVEVTVHVAGGDYETNGNLDQDIRLGNVSAVLLGGYNPDNWSERDPTAWESKITDTSTGGGTEPAPVAAIAGLDVPPTTLIDGFSIQGGHGSHSAAIAIAGSPEIRNCKIVAGTAENTSAALGLSGSAAKIHHNTIIGATDSGGSSNAAVSTPYTDGVLIYQNRISLTSGTSIAAVHIDATAIDAEVFNNLILAANGSTSSTGVATYASDILIYNNTIRADNPTTTAGNTTMGIGALNNGEPILYNNILVSTGSGNVLGIYVASASAGSPANPTVKNNAIAATYLAYLDDTAGRFLTNAVDINSTVTDPIGNTGMGTTDFTSPDGPDGSLLTIDDNDWSLLEPNVDC